MGATEGGALFSTTTEGSMIGVGSAGFASGFGSAFDSGLSSTLTSAGATVGWGVTSVFGADLADGEVVSAVLNLFILVVI